MISVVGVFRERADAERVPRRLEQIAIPRERYVLLCPTGCDPIQRVPTVGAEQPGTSQAFGGVVGGSLGGAIGLGGGAAAATLIPGVGPVMMLGLLGMGLLGAGGALAGAKIGAKLEEELDDGLPIDELYVYEDALRRGRSVVVALARDEEQAERARTIMKETGAESLDAARHEWWVGLRDDEELRYVEDKGDWAQDEPRFRTGFEAAQHVRLRGKTYDEAVEVLRVLYPDSYADPAFVRGYSRGASHRSELLEKYEA